MDPLDTELPPPQPLVPLQPVPVRRSHPRGRRIWNALKWLRAFSFPRRFPIVQFPNLPLALAFVAGQVARHAHGSARTYALAISYLATAVWAWLELTDGVNWFRRLLGAFYVASTAFHLEGALER